MGREVLVVRDGSRVRDRMVRPPRPVRVEERVRFWRARPWRWSEAGGREVRRVVLRANSAACSAARRVSWVCAKVEMSMVRGWWRLMMELGWKL